MDTETCSLHLLPYFDLKMGHLMAQAVSSAEANLGSVSWYAKQDPS